MKHSIAGALLLILAATLFAAGTTPVKSGNSDKSAPVNNKVDLKGATDAITIPQMINYQGKLTDGSGTPTNTPQNLTFRLYAESTGGATIWTETQNNVPVNSGLFNVLLGSSSAITGIPDGPNCFLEVTVGSVTIAPRTRLVSTAYSYLARKADTANYALVSPGSCNWVRATPPDSVLYTVNRLGIARGRAGNALIGDSASTHVNLGVACTTGTGGQHDPYATVGGGWLNRAHGHGATVSGGTNNATGASQTTIGGGANNTASAYLATIGGGCNDTATGMYSTIAGGANNLAAQAYATVAGGGQNAALGFAGTVAGGRYDTTRAVYGGVLSGFGNLAGDAPEDTGAVVGGGTFNRATAKYSSVGGGYSNTASGDGATVGGGRADTAKSKYCGVLSGTHNVAGNLPADSCAVVPGGASNTASGLCSTVGGGALNLASVSWATVGGGYQNAARGYNATVAGGLRDTAAGDWSFATNGYSVVPAAYQGSAAFNGTVATAPSQLRCYILSKTGGSFTIDHPLDPSGKILNHYFVESPDMSNLYSGSVVLDANGRAEVRLPDYFDALNRNPRVQLTGVGTYEVFVAEKVVSNRFVIGGKPRTEVFWQVTGDRKDPSAEVIRYMMPVEQPKTGALAGRMLDDDFLVGCMQQLEQMGKAGEFHFRTAAGRQRYEDMLKQLREAKSQRQH
jgi:hypothetical protein